MSSQQRLPNELLLEIPAYLDDGKIDHFDPVAIKPYRT